MELSESLIAIVRHSRHPVVLTGAELSQECGITPVHHPLPGPWRRYDAMRLASPQGFADDPDLVWAWHEWHRAEVLRGLPNSAYWAVAEWGCRDPDLTIICQTVDGLHERAGSRNIVNLHGSLHEARCSVCAQPHRLSDFPADWSDETTRCPPPACAACGGLVRPGVLWAGEWLQPDTHARAMLAVDACDLLVCIGTCSLTHPANRLPLDAIARGVPVIQINPGPTSLDGVAYRTLHGQARLILPALLGRAWEPANVPRSSRVSLTRMTGTVVQRRPPSHWRGRL